MLLICVLVLILGATSQMIQCSAIKKSCDDYLPSRGFTYKIFKTPTTWNHAKVNCEKEGSTLYYPKDRKEANDILYYYLCQSQYDNLRNIFIGVADWIVEDIFVTVDGQLISDTQNEWLPNEPKIGGKNGCAILQWDGYLKEDSCNSRRPYICKKLETSKSDTACGFFASGNRHNYKIKTCYKFHLTPRNWTDAFDTCEQEGSHLAVINSEEEANYLVRMIAAANTDRVKGDHVKGAVHIGFRKDDEAISLQDEEIFEWGPSSVKKENRNRWVTVTKGALQDSGYNKWGLSHRLKQTANCGAMFHNGLLSAIECHKKMFFICEYTRQNTEINFPKY